MRVHLIRHAPAIKPPGVLYGQTDYPADLSDKSAISALAAVIPQTIPWFCSPLKRARDTAKAVAEMAQRTGSIVTDDRLREQHYGLLEERVLTEVLLEFPAASRGGRVIDVLDFLPENGETYNNLIDRVDSFLREYSKRPTRELAAFCHRGVIQAVLHLAGNELDPEMWSRSIPHYSHTVVEL